MALTKKISKIGNSYGILIPSDIMGLLNMKPGAEVEIQVDKGGLFIHPVVKEDKIVAEAFAKFVNRFGDTLRKLAE